VRAAPGEPRVEGFVDPEPERARQRVVLHGVFEAMRREIPDLRISDDGPGRLVDLTLDAPGRALDRVEVGRIAAAIEAEGGRCLVSSVQVHITLCASDKAAGLARAARGCLGLDVGARRGRWLFVGDSPNDAGAFAYFPHSVGVANVEEFLPMLEHRPAYVTAGDRGRGFGELAGRVLASRGVPGPAQG
jgi:hypothetical protein